MDNFIEFSVSTWGVTFSSAPLYFNLSWGVVLTALTLVIVRKILKNRQG